MSVPCASWSTTAYGESRYSLGLGDLCAVFGASLK